MLKWCWILVICHFSFVIDARAQTAAPPQLTAPVNDFAQVLDDASEAELDRRIRALKAASGDVVVVATVKTFQPYGDIDSYAVKMFENGGRGIGDKGKDNGVLVLVAVDDRRARVEVGYDLEQFVTDGYAGETIRTAMGPHFARGDYGAGLLSGVTRIINRIAERRGVPLQDVPRPPPAREPETEFPIGLIFLIIMIIFWMIGGGGRRRRRRGGWVIGPWSGWNSGVGPFGGGGFGGGFGGFGGGGGGFGGFGGGRSGGGGASGGW